MQNPGQAIDARVGIADAQFAQVGAGVFQGVTAKDCVHVDFHTSVVARTVPPIDGPIVSAQCTSSDGVRGRAPATWQHMKLSTDRRTPTTTPQSTSWAGTEALCRPIHRPAGQGLLHGGERCLLADRKASPRGSRDP